jgi:excisionase family DNA binding protein
MEYVTVVEGARRLGISDKTIRRAIHAGKLPARYPHKNRCEIAVSDLEAWRQPPTERDATDHRLAELETRLHQVELQVHQLLQAQRVPPVTHNPRAFAYKRSRICTPSTAMKLRSAGARALSLASGKEPENVRRS